MNIDQFLKQAEKAEKKATKTPEKEIEKAFCKAAENLGFKCLKLTLLNLRGFPDRTVIGHGGKVFFVEFKTKKGQLSDNQIKWRDILTHFGFTYYVCNSVDQVENILKNHC